MLPTYGGAFERCQQMLADYDDRTGRFSGCFYTRQSDLFASLPNQEIVAYLNSPSVLQELETERLRQSVRHPPAGAELSPYYQEIRSHVRDLLERQGYKRPPFAIKGSKHRPSKQLTKFTAARIAEHGGREIEFRKADGNDTIIFKDNKPYLDVVRGSIEFHSLTGTVKLRLGGGGLQPFGFHLSLQPENLSGLTNCRMLGFEPNSDFEDYLRFGDSEAKMNNVVELIFAQLSYF